MKITKGILLSLLFIVFTLRAISQESPFITHGHKMIGGSATCQFSMTDKSFYIGGFPSFNYFVINNLALGFDLGYGYYHHKSGTDYIYSSDNWKFNPNIRFYFIKHFFLETNGGIIWTKGQYHYLSSGNSYGPYDHSNDITSFNFNLNIGNSIFIRDNVALDLILNYYHNSSSYHTSTPASAPGQTSQDDKNKGLQILVGFQIFM